MCTFLRSGPALSAIALLVLAGSAASAEAPVYPIGPGDILQVTIYAGGAEQEQFTSEVSSEGTITTPLLGQVNVEGLTLTEVGELLARRLLAGYYVNPRVIVSIKEYAGKVYVLGEVAHPGAYDVRKALTALNACILAGGFSEYAALGRVKVIRQSKGRIDVLKIDLGKVRKGKKPDLILRRDDRIEVPHRRF